MTRVHRELAFSIAGPLRLGTVTIKLDSVFVGIAKIERFAHAVIGCAVQLDTRLNDAAQRIAESGAGGIENRQVVQARGSWCGRPSTFALPSVEADVVVVTPSGDERCGVAHALHDLEPEHAAIEIESALKICDLEVHVANASFRRDRHRNVMINRGINS